MKTTLILLLTLAITACTGGTEKPPVQKSEAERTVSAAIKGGQLDPALHTIDSLEQMGALSMRRADFWRGMAYDFIGHKPRLAKYYYQRSFDTYDPEQVDDWRQYVETGGRLAYMHRWLHDDEASQRLASRIVETASAHDGLPNDWHAFLNDIITGSQFRLGQYEEVKKNVLHGYEILCRDVKKGTSNRVIFTSNVISKFISVKEYDTAEEWLKRGDEEVAVFEANMDRTDANRRKFLAEYKGLMSLFHTLILQGRGEVQMAAATYNAIPDSQLVHIGNLSHAIDYLMEVGRDEDALKLFNLYDSIFAPSDGEQADFDHIMEDLVPRFEANRNAGHDREALAIAQQICNTLDTVISTQRKSDIAELSIIYEVQQRELELQEARFNTTFYRALCGAILLIALLIGRLLWHAHQYNKVLTRKNRELYEEVQRREAEQQQTDKRLQSCPEEQLNAEQRLYVRLCQVMEQQKPFTNPDLSRDDLARLVDTNYKYVADAIRVCCDGMTISDFLNHHRLSYASYLLASSDEPISTVSDLAGFNSRSHFNKVFREHYKLTPSEYRKAALGEG